MIWAGRVEGAVRRKMGGWETIAEYLIEKSKSKIGKTIVVIVFLFFFSIVIMEGISKIGVKL